MNLDWSPGEPRVAGEEYERYAPIYDLLFQDLDEDADYYLGCAAAAGGPVLELGVGTGRLARRLLEAGHAVHGIDASPAAILGTPSCWPKAASMPASSPASPASAWPPTAGRRR